MKTMLTLLLVIAAFPAFSSEDKPKNKLDEDIDKVLSQMGPPLKELSALDESDKKIAESNKAQIATTEMLNRSEQKIRRNEIPVIEERARQWDEETRSLIASGCPAKGGMVPKELADRCNPLITAHNKKQEDIWKDAQAVNERLATIQKTRQAVTETTLANVQKQKANTARREELQNVKKELEAKLRKLYADRIVAALTTAEAKRKASEACSKNFQNEKLSCCNSVVWDGVNPTQCEVELIFSVFKGAGIFSLHEVKPN